MCGIVGYVGERDCTDVLLDSLSKLEYRGYDSAGIAVFENGNISVEKSKGELKNLREKIENEHKPDGHCGQDGQLMVNHQILILIHMEVREFQLFTTELSKTIKTLRNSLQAKDILSLVRQIQKL